MLKFPAAKSKPWFSAVARPKPTVRTDRDRVSSRARTNKTAHTVKLEEKSDATLNTFHTSNSESNHTSITQHGNSPRLPVLVAEVDQAGNVEQELHKVVQHEQDQTQTVQAETHGEKHDSSSLRLMGGEPPV